VLGQYRCASWHQPCAGYAIPARFGHPIESVSRGPRASRSRSRHGPMGVCIRTSKNEPKNEHVSTALESPPSGEASISSGRMSTCAIALRATPASTALNPAARDVQLGSAVATAGTSAGKNDLAPMNRAVKSVAGDQELLPKRQPDVAVEADGKMQAMIGQLVDVGGGLVGESESHYAVAERLIREPIPDRCHADAYGALVRAPWLSRDANTERRGRDRGPPSGGGRC
jgi:hypothetical protein